MCYGALKSNIDQGRRPRSIVLFSAPKHHIAQNEVLQLFYYI
jgi:hypothetical protein